MQSPRCKRDNQSFVDACQSLIPNIALLCSAISETYPPGDSSVMANVDALISLFYAFPEFTDFTGYLSIVDCMQVIHSDISAQVQAINGSVSTGFYYPLEFVLFEFPFAWYARLSPEPRLCYLG